MWIDPRTQYLQKLGVEFHVGTRLIKIQTDGMRVTGVNAESSTITADFYVAALPVEAMAT